MSFAIFKILQTDKRTSLGVGNCICQARNKEYITEKQLVFQMCRRLFPSVVSKNHFECLYHVAFSTKTNNSVIYIYRMLTFKAHSCPICLHYI